MKVVIVSRKEKRYFKVPDDFNCNNIFEFEAEMQKRCAVDIDKETNGATLSEMLEGTPVELAEYYHYDIRIDRIILGSAEAGKIYSFEEANPPRNCVIDVWDENGQRYTSVPVDHAGEIKFPEQLRQFKDSNPVVTHWAVVPAFDPSP